MIRTPRPSERISEPSIPSPDANSPLSSGDRIPDGLEAEALEVADVAGGEIAKARYTMHLDERSRWLESGEFTPDDGATWHLFLEMTLTRR
jgi:hypothetical protein